MALPLPEAMLASPVDELPTGGVAYEAKWDGFRAFLARPAGGPAQLRSRRGTSLTVAFGDIAAAAERDLPDESLVLDGELLIWADGRLRFERLQRRMNRTAAAVAREIREAPAHFVAFDLLHRGEDLMRLPYEQRRRELERLFTEAELGPPWTLCPMTLERSEAERWMRQWAAADVGLEGVVVKRLREPYRPGVRAWRKVRIRNTSEAVIGAVTGSLHQPTSVLLGRFDQAGRLRYVGRSTTLPRRLGQTVACGLVPAAAGHPWRGRSFSAGWGTGRTLSVTLVEPTLVVEVSGDTAVDAGRWRHPVRVVRVRGDMAPRDIPRFDTDGETSSL
ncbi:ATP-dependent DNA ligase [Streptomyces lydicus]|uniref:ATP-dependent DNA ligase n=1 Tax=Streptomyces lydicus TaxID=47763 RepID=UPI0033DE5B00